MVKKILAALLCILMFAFFSGCSRRSAPKLEFKKPETLGEESSQHIKKELSAGDMQLLIDASVSVPKEKELFEARLVFSESKMNDMLNGFFLEKYPEAERLEPVNDGELILFGKKEDADMKLFFSANINGRVYFADVVKDSELSKEARALEGGHLLEYGYITTTVPANTKIGPAEAGKLVSDFFEKYSCFSFAPWNLLAAESLSAGCGYYDILIQAHYRSIPIIPFSENGFGASAAVSDFGISYFQGPLFLEPNNERKIEKIASPSSVLDRFEKDFTVLSQLGGIVELSEICLNYMVQKEADGSLLLSPVWVLRCRDVEKGGENRSAQFFVFYSAENGSLLDSKYFGI